MEAVGYVGYEASPRAGLGPRGRIRNTATEVRPRGDAADEGAGGYRNSRLLSIPCFHPAEHREASVPSIG